MRQCTRFPWFPLFLLLTTSIARADKLPIVPDVPAQPLAAQVTRVVEALDQLGQPLPDDVKAQIAQASKALDDPSSVKKIQELLDPFCLIGVEINPESRVKAGQGEAPASLVQQGWRAFLIKVHNGAGVTAELKASSPNAAPVYKQSTGSPDPKPTIPANDLPNRWLDLNLFRDRPLNKTLSGLPLEYRILQLYSRDAGPREAKLTFDVGQGTQDLGFRSDVDILFKSAPAVTVTLGVKDDDGTPVMASFLIKDAQGRVYPFPGRRLAPDFFFHPQVYRKDGESVTLPPGTYNVEWTRGPEYLDADSQDHCPRRENTPRGLSAQTLDEPGKDAGWFSGDHHVHAAGCGHYESPTEGVTPADMMRHILGEDLDVGCVSDVGTVLVRAEAVLRRQPQPSVDPRLPHALRRRGLRLPLVACRAPLPACA